MWLRDLTTYVLLVTGAAAPIAAAWQAGPDLLDPVFALAAALLL